MLESPENAESAAESLRAAQQASRVVCEVRPDDPRFMGVLPLFAADAPPAKGAISLSADGKRFLFGEDLYQVEGGLMLSRGKAPGESSALITSPISPDGTFYLRCMPDVRGFEKVDAESGEVLAVCDDEREDVNVLAIACGGELMLSGFQGGWVDMWHLNGNYKSAVFLYEPVKRLITSHDGKWLFYRGDTQMMWAGTFNQFGGFMLADGFAHVSLSYDDTRFLVSKGEGGLDLVQVKSKKEELHWDIASSWAFFLPGDREMLSAYGNKITLWELSPDGSPSCRGVVELPAEVQALCMQEGGRMFAAATAERAYVWDCGISRYQ